MSEKMPDPIRVQDTCAWCGHALAVVSRSWEGVNSDSARLICANFCTDHNGCADPTCAKNCRQRSDHKPERAINEIQRRQQIMRRKEGRRDKAAK